MGTEDWVLKGTKLITNTKKQRLKIQSSWNFKNTILKKEEKKREEKQTISLTSGAGKTGQPLVKE